MRRGLQLVLRHYFKLALSLDQLAKRLVERQAVKHEQRQLLVVQDATRHARRLDFGLRFLLLELNKHLVLLGFFALLLIKLLFHLLQLNLVLVFRA